MAKTDNIPREMQPNPRDFTFDLEHVLGAVVSLRALVPEDAFTASTLGTERAGSAVHIGDGLFLTIAYLVTEAETVWLTTSAGQSIQAHVLATDNESGFGLVQGLGRLDVAALKLGDSRTARVGTPVLFAAAGGRKHSVAAKVAGRQEFAGYWEYLIEDAIFTAPAHPFWGGAGLIGPDGELLGIGSLVLQQGGEGGRRTDMNMVVPVQLLQPVMDDMLSLGRVDRPARPWLGLYAMEDDDQIVVGGLADGGPADQAGLRVGDRIAAVGGREPQDLAGLWRMVWASGSAGAAVTLTISRGDRVTDVSIASASRASFLKTPLMH